MKPHCAYCTEPWRAAILALVKSGRGPSDVAHRYGLRHSTVGGMATRARQYGCIPAKTCRYCPLELPQESKAIRCAARECKRAMWREQMQRRREGDPFEWPTLPPRPRRYVNAEAETPSPPPKAAWVRPPPLASTLGSTHLRAA